MISFRLRHRLSFALLPRGGITFSPRPLPFQQFRRIVSAMTRETIIASTSTAPGAPLSRGLLLLTRF